MKQPLRANDLEGPNIDVKLQVHFSVVIPVYRSIRTLPRVVAEIVQTFDPLGIRYEILLVEDASGSDTWQAVNNLREKYPDRIVAVRLANNVGQHHAVLCGLRHASGELVATIDDDLQHPPGEIRKLWAVMAEREVDVVYARYQRKQSLLRNLFGVPLLRWARWAYQVPVIFSGFRLIRREIVEKVAADSKSRVLIDQLILAATKRIADVEVEHRARVIDTSTYSIRKLVKLALLVIACAPERARAVTGIALIGAGLLGLGLGFWTQSFQNPTAVLLGQVLCCLSAAGLGTTAAVAFGVSRFTGKVDTQYEIAEIYRPARSAPFPYRSKEIPAEHTERAPSPT